MFLGCSSFKPTRKRPSGKRTASTKRKSASPRRSESTGTDHVDEKRRNSEVARKNSEVKLPKVSSESRRRTDSSSGISEGLRKISFSSLPDDEEKKLGLGMPVVVNIPQVRHLKI